MAPWLESFCGRLSDGEEKRMQMHIEDVRTLWESSTYSRFVRAYCPDVLEKETYINLMKDFMLLVKEEYPEFFYDWDPHSFLLFDSLQQACVDFLRQRCPVAQVLTDHVSSLLYRVRLLKLCLKEWAMEEGLVVDEEVCEMFSWYCHAYDHQFLMDFAPYEYHMGDEHWRSEIRLKWDLFLAYCKRGAHPVGV